MTRTTPAHDASMLRNHWWPRPGWYPGRIVYTWHLTFQDDPELHRLARAYQNALHGLPGLHPVPTEWLHLTMQGLGYLDEITDEQRAAAITATRRALAGIEPFTLTFDRPHVLDEAIAVPPMPARPVEAAYSAIRAAMRDALGADHLHTGPEQARGFRPHVTLAYSGIEAPSEPYTGALRTADIGPATVHVHEVNLIRQERLLDPHWLYRWQTDSTAPLGCPLPDGPP
ncbi:MAG: 2'-5' RNA ligase family protein [Pseudonocardia sp.]